MAKKNSSDLNSANDFIDYAKNSPLAVARETKRGFISITNKSGEKVLIKPGTDQLDPQTKTNLKRWFKLLGIMILCIGAWAIDYYWWAIRNLWWIIQHS